MDWKKLYQGHLYWRGRDWWYNFSTNLLLKLMARVMVRDRYLARKLYLLADACNPKADREILGATRFKDWKKEELPKYLQKFWYS